MDAAAVINSIPFKDWQPAVGSPGVVIGGIEELNQSVQIVLSTPKGSDAHRPEFGSDLHLYVDYPQNRITPHLVRETYGALQRWEPRIKVLKASVSFDEAAVIIDVTWQPIDESIPVQNTRVSLPR